MAKDWFPHWLEGGMPEGKGKPPSRSSVFAALMIIGALVALAVIIAGVAAGVPADEMVEHFADLLGGG